MTRPENTQTVSLNLDKDLYRRVKVRAIEESETAGYQSATAVLVRAITEYMDGKPDDERFAAIETAYRELGEEGREWLASCARIAIGNKDMRG